MKPIEKMLGFTFSKYSAEYIEGIYKYFTFYKSL